MEASWLPDEAPEGQKVLGNQNKGGCSSGPVVGIPKTEPGHCLGWPSCCRYSGQHPICWPSQPTGAPHRGVDIYSAAVMAYWVAQFKGVAAFIRQQLHGAADVRQENCPSD